MKKVLLVVIDALSSRVVRPAVENGKLPMLARLIERGHVNWKSLAIFPSITPAATSSIITGRYPAEHRVMGAHFFDRPADKVYYFGSDMWVILARRFGNYFDDFLFRLNSHCLDAPTIFELLEQQGHASASLNFLVFRGKHEHKVTVPWLLRLLPGVPHAAHLSGPETLCLGDFVAARDQNGKAAKLHKSARGIFSRYGFNDDNTAQLLLQLADNGFPPFTLAYFPDNDFKSHEVGPANAVSTLQNVDQALEKLVDRIGGLEAFLDQFHIVITGDHSQSDVVEDESRAAIQLEDTLSEFDIVAAGEDWNSHEELMICPNLRAAQIYCRKRYWSELARVAESVLKDPRVDQVIWRETEKTDESLETPWFRVVTADRGEVRFRRTDDAGAPSDDYEGQWEIEGSLEALDAQVVGERVQYGVYPNALERIAASFDRRYAGDLWVTSHEGYEFKLASTEPHPGGGSHGSLHESDSTSPLIVAGAEHAALDDRIPFRTVDVLPLCMQLLGLDSTRTVRQSHVLVNQPSPSS